MQESILPCFISMWFSYSLSRVSIYSENCLLSICGTSWLEIHLQDSSWLLFVLSYFPFFLSLSIGLGCRRFLYSVFRLESSSAFCLSNTFFPPYLCFASFLRASAFTSVIFILAISRIRNLIHCCGKSEGAACYYLHSD